jgi:phosphate-selective porin OprO and OprP
MNFRKTLLLATVLSAIPATAHAQDNSSEVQALRDEIAALKEQISAISNKVDANAKAAEKKGATEIKWKGAPEMEGAGGWTFKPRGRLQYDVANVSAPSAIVDNSLGFSNELRRARIGVEGNMPGGFGYKFEVDFGNSNVEFTDAFLTYKDKDLLITAGQHNNFQSLEELSSSNDTSFIERAAFTDAFGFERRAGLSAQYKTGPVLLQAGVFTDNVADLNNDENDGIGLDGRAVIAPKVGEAQLHFGGSYHWRSLGDAVTSARYRQRPLVRSTDVRFIDTGTLAGAQSETGYGLEAAAISGRFHAAAESYWQKIDRDGFADPTFKGHSIEAGIFLSNDTRGYKDGIFKGVKVNKPVGKGGLGALQFNVRYDYLDLNDGTVIGGKQNGYMASLIWTPIDYVRFMINYGKLSYKDAVIAAGLDRDYSVDVVGARAQISF